MILLILTALTLQCTSGVAPSADKIVVQYVGSIYQDIYRKNPIGVDLSNAPGIRIAHTLTRPLFLEYYLYRMGLSDLLEELAIDYVITDTLVQNREFFSIQKSMGYAITNYGGIRFAVLSSPDSVTIENQVQFTLVKQRSDVVWVVDQAVLDLPPSMINFYIKDRMLSDTSMSPIKHKADTLRSSMVQEFRDKIETELDRRLYVGGSIDAHILSLVAEKQAVNVVVYPENLFINVVETDSIALRELMEHVAFEMKFKKTSMNRDSLIAIVQAKGYKQWGNIKKENLVLLPDAMTGKHIFDLYNEKE